MTQQSTSETVQPAETAPKPRFRLKHGLLSSALGLGAGFVASLGAVVLMGILRLAAGVPTPIELFGDFLLKHISVFTFIQLLATFGSHAKTAPLGLALLGMIGLGTVLGVPYALLARMALPTHGYRPGRREWITGVAFSLVMTAVGILVFWNELPQHFLGLPFNWAAFVTASALLADFILFAVVLCLAYRALLPKQSDPTVSAIAQNRRQLFARVGITVLTVGAGAGTIGLIRSFLNHYSSYDGMTTSSHHGFTAPITPNSEHYVVTQNPSDPSVNTDLWQLEVTGLVNNPGSSTYEEVQNFPSISRAITLECIANSTPNGGHLISTAIWQGVTLGSLLQKHGGVQASAKYVAFYSVDGYNTSLPLDEVLAADPLLAYRMNGEMLPQRHGFPIRVLIPGRYGEENPKWLTRIELSDHFVGGLYSDQGWYNGPLHTMARIDRPSLPVAVGQAVEIGGLAFAGDRGIQQVEVSVDGGKTWKVAKLGDHSISGAGYTALSSHPSYAFRTG